MKVSVVVPVYNVEKFLARCLDSILAQTEKDFELIAVNDGSTDSSAAILASYAALDARIKIVTQRNKGLSGARNAGLKVAKGEWITFVDSDDFIPPDALEKFLRVAAESGERVIVSKEFARDSVPPNRSASTAWRRCAPALEKLIHFRKAQSSAWNKFFSSSLLEKRRFIEGIYFEDWPFITELFGNIESFALVEEPMYVYCHNADAASIVRSNFSQKKAASYLKGIRFCLEAFKRHPRKKVAAKRVATAVKMLVGKACKSADPEIKKMVSLGIETLAKDKLLSLGSLNLKTRFRLWRLNF